MVSLPLHAATYRLIDDRYLEIGNQWIYQIHTTLENSVSVDKWDTQTNSITGTKNVSGHLTKIEEITDSAGTGYEYYDMSDDYLLDYGYDDNDGMHVVFINNNPGEVAPVWINTTDSDHLLGTGDYQLQIDDPYVTWTCTITNYITYVNQEAVTVPAGTFDCIVVIYKMVYSDTLGFQMEFTTTSHLDPEVGIIKEVDSSWIYDPFDDQTYYNESVSKLTSTNVKPSITTDKQNIDFGEFSASDTFDVWNDGRSTLHYNISVSEGDLYFNVSPITGSSTGSTDKNTHTVTVDRSAIPDDQTVTGRIMISATAADNSPQYIDLSSGNAPRLESSDFKGFCALTYSWLRTDCDTSNDWCFGNDLDLSGNVNYVDIDIFCSNWLADPNLLAHWTLDDNEPDTFVSDITINGHNGTASVNTELMSEAGMINNCFDFAGTDAVEINDHSKLSFSGSGFNPFSISAWVFVTANASQQIILSKFDGTTGASDREWRFYLNSNEQLVLNQYDEGSNARATIRTNGELSAGWHHVVYTYDGTGGDSATDGMDLYIDSDVQSDITKTIVGTYTAMVNSSTKVVIGAEFGSAGTLTDFWRDKIDEVQIFSKSLTTAEIEALYAEGL